MKIGFVICSRSNSSRVPRKPHRKLGGKTVLEHLIDRCLKSNLPVFLAVPGRDFDDYKHIRTKYEKAHPSGGVGIYTGQTEDPLARMLNTAIEEELDAVIRVCHDKVFIETELVKQAVTIFEATNADYIYSKDFAQGTAFEIISTKALKLASDKFKNVEHVSYAIKLVAENIVEMNLDEKWKTDHRFLIDYPEDLKLLELVFRSLGDNCCFIDAKNLLDKNCWMSRVNRLPLVSVYTCAKDAQKWISKCMGSVSMQQDFHKMEYILIDDGSKDQTAHLMAKFCQTYKNAIWIKNEKNIGLSSSSNIAIANARGKYIIRLDADDYFITDSAIGDLVKELESRDVDVIYPDNYFGSFSIIQSAHLHHHVGGALFKRSALNHVKFTDGLRNYEGLDLFIRARDSLFIDYLSKPIFFYRQHKNSMSKSNLEERKKTFEKITKAKSNV